MMGLLWDSQLHLCLPRCSRLGWMEHVPDPPLFQHHFSPGSLALFPQISPFEARPTAGQVAEMIQELHSSLCGWRSWLEGNSTGHSVFYFRSNLLCFFLALFRPSKDGHFTINRCFSFCFFLRFPFNFGLRSCCGHSWKALLKLAKCEGNATQRNVMQRNAT